MNILTFQTMFAAFFTNSIDTSIFFRTFLYTFFFILIVKIISTIITSVFIVTLFTVIHTFFEFAFIFICIESIYLFRFIITHSIFFIQIKISLGVTNFTFASSLTLKAIIIAFFTLPISTLKISLWTFLDTFV